MKKVAMALGIVTITSVGYTTVASASPYDHWNYQAFLPRYKGITHSSWGRYFGGTGTEGEHLLESLDSNGAGSYAVAYYMVDVNEVQKGTYKNIDEGFYQYFNLWTPLVTEPAAYRLRLMNYSSVSADTLAIGDWATEHFYLPSGSWTNEP